MTRRLVSTLVVLLLALLAAAHAQTNATNGTSPSQCELCRDQKSCSLAYKNSPGDFCGNWLSSAGARLACCCPTGMCATTTSQYSCLCKKTKEKKTWLLWAGLGAFVVGLAIAAGVWYCMKKRREAEFAQQPPATTYVQQGAYPAGGYAQGYAPGHVQGYDQYGQPIVYGAPGYAPAPGYGHGGYAHGGHGGYGHGRSGMGGGAVVAGVAGGFLGGMLVGDMLADAGDGGGMGGGDVFAGDF